MNDEWLARRIQIRRFKQTHQFNGNPRPNNRPQPEVDPIERLAEAVRSDTRQTIDVNVSFKQYGNCVGLDTAAFYPGPGETTDALAVCDGCAVRTECLEHALKFEDFGIWGGMLERQRRQLRRQRKAGA